MFRDSTLRKVAFTVLAVIAIALCSVIANAIVWTSQQGYAPQGTGGFAFNSSGGTQSFYLSSGGSLATSTTCNQILLNLAGTGVLSTNGATINSGTPAHTNGIYFATAGTSTFQAAPLTLSFSNLNSLQLVGTGQVGYIYSK